MTVELVAIGSELLLGQIVDSNSAWMAQRLAEVGADLFRKTTVGDNLGRITEVLAGALERADCVITGGGLGPTEDDLTREAVAAATGRALVQDPRAVADLEERFRSRGFVLTKNNEKQALIPEGATLVHNPNGTAPSFIVEDERGTVICLPGVPFEMKWLFEHEVVPYLQRRYQLQLVIHHRVLKVTDIGESAVDDKIGRIMTESTNPKVGVLAHPGQVDVRISARAGTEQQARQLIGPVEEQVRGLLGEHIFGADAETLEGVVGERLRGRDWTVASFEDLTGGAVASALQAAAGELFTEATIVAGHEARARMARAGGEEQLPDADDALTLTMARVVQRLTGADLAVAVHVVPGAERASGDAGNLGRGDTYFAAVAGDQQWQHHVAIGGSGIIDRRRAANYTLSLLRKLLAG